MIKWFYLNNGKQDEEIFKRLYFVFDLIFELVNKDLNLLFFNNFGKI